jgi:hypothetical protein
MNKWITIPSDEIISQIAGKLAANNFNPVIVESKEEAKEQVLAMIPEESEVLANTSVTLEQTGILEEIDDSGKYHSVRKHIFSLDREKDADKIRQLRSIPLYGLGSVHAITHDGQLIIASNTGSQLASEVYGAEHVIFVASANKIVEDFDEAQKRIKEHIMPLESVRMRKAYHLPDTFETFPSKILMYNREVVSNRVHIFLVKEILGF